MCEKEYQTITRIILDNFDLCEFDDRQLERRSYFLRKPKFSFNALLENLKKLKSQSFLQSFRLLAGRRSVGKVPFSLSLADLLATEFNANDFPFAQMMPVKLIDLNARDKYLIKQKLNLLLEEHLQVTFGDCQMHFRNLELSKMIEQRTEPLDCDPAACLNRLGQALATVEADDYCNYLRELYYQDLYSLQLIEPKDRDSSLPNQNSGGGRDEQIIFETLENAVQSRCYHKIFKSILHTNQISNSTLNDEICLFTTSWTYSKAMLKSLRDEIRLFIARNLSASLPGSSQQRAAQLAEKKQLLTNLTELNEEQFLLFADLDSRNERLNKTGKPFKPNDRQSNDGQPRTMADKSTSDRLFEFYLNELAFLAIDLTRDLLLFLVGNLTEDEARSGSQADEDLGSKIADAPSGQQKPQGAMASPNENPPIFQLLMDDSRQRPPDARCTISLHKDHGNAGNAKLVNQLKVKLQLFINQLYHRKLLRKHLLALNHEPDVDWYLNTVWTSICRIIDTLAHIDQSYLVEIFLGNKRHLQSGSSFIARKYLYYIVRSLFETLYLICSTICGPFAGRHSAGELARNKAKLDELIDRAFLIHLKNELLLLLADPLIQIDPTIQLEPPNLDRFLQQNTAITRQTVTETLAQLISLIRLKLLQCSFFASPLYSEFVKMNERYRKADDLFERQLNVNLFKLLNLQRKSGAIRDPTKAISEIIENEILMRYLNLTPKLECLFEIAEIGSQIVLGLGMRKIF